MIFALVRASHPEPAVAVTTISALLSLGVGRPATGVIAAAGAVLASQLTVGWVNDAIDAPRDAAVGREDKPVAAGRVSRRLVAVLGAIAAVATVLLGFLSGPVAGVVCAGAVASALLYDWPLKSTAISVLPYAVSFACLPVFVVLGAGHRPPGWMIAAGGLLGAGAHFVNALPDLADDARTGVRGLPHRFGRTGSLVASGVLLIAATAVLAFGPPGPPPLTAWPVLAVAVVALPLSWYVTRREPSSKAPFRAVMLMALIDVVFLLANGLRL